MLHNASTTINMYRRVSVEKGENTIPTPDQFGPIDVFPLMARMLSTPATRTIEGWKRAMTHRGQYASKGGTIQATTRLAIKCEQVVRKTLPTYSLTIDFSKLFNMISPAVAVKACALMGLAED